MKTLIKYMILLLAGGIIIPIYQRTGAVHQTAPVITPVVKAPQHPQHDGDAPAETSFLKAAATKLLPALKYF